MNKKSIFDFHDKLTDKNLDLCDPLWGLRYGPLISPYGQSLITYENQKLPSYYKIFGRLAECAQCPSILYAHLQH